MTAENLFVVLDTWPHSLTELRALAMLCARAEGMNRIEAATRLPCDPYRWLPMALRWHEHGLATREKERSAAGAGRPRYRYFATPKAYELLRLEAPARPTPSAP